MEVYYHSYEIGPNGEKQCFLTRKVQWKENPLPWQKKGLSFTASGYGNRIPTTMMINLNGRWRRVYCCIHSNNGTLYIGSFNTMSRNRVTKYYN